MELDEQTKEKIIKVLRTFPRMFVVAPKDSVLTFEPKWEDGFQVWTEPSFFGGRFHVGNLFHMHANIWEFTHKRIYKKTWIINGRQIGEINIFKIE